MIRATPPCLARSFDRSLKSHLLLGLALLGLLTGACNPRVLSRYCADLMNGIYFQGDIAYVSSYISGGSVLLWTVDLNKNEVSDVRVVRYVDTPPEDSQARAIWDDASGERAIRQTWLNKGFARDYPRKDFTAADGTTYSIASRGELLQIDMTRNGVTKTVLRREADIDVNNYSAEVTLVEPGKLYILVGREQHSFGKQEDAHVTAKGAVLYVVDAETGGVTKELALSTEAFPAYGDSLAQAPNGLVYGFSRSSYDMLVIDPVQDKLLGKITLCK